jgi:GTP-binding protein
MTFIEALPPEEDDVPLEGKDVDFKWQNYHEEAINDVTDDLDDEDWDEDDYDVEVEYRQ